MSRAVSRPRRARVARPLTSPSPGCAGGDNPEAFDGLIMLDECHNAKTIDLDKDGNAVNVGKGTLCSRTAARGGRAPAPPPPRAGRLLQRHLRQPAQEPRLHGAPGPGGAETKHPGGFNPFLVGLDRLGTGAMELHSSSSSAGRVATARPPVSLLAAHASRAPRSAPEVDRGHHRAHPLVLGVRVRDDRRRRVGPGAGRVPQQRGAVDVPHPSFLVLPVADRCEKLKEAQEKNKRLSAIEACGDAAATLGEDLLYHRELHPASDSEDSSSDDNDDAWAEQRQLRRRFRDCPPKTLKGLVWSAHQRFFRSLCIAAKVDTAIELAQRAAHEDGHCCVIGLQSIRLRRDNGGGPRATTDPVAAAVILNERGAPARLNVRAAAPARGRRRRGRHRSPSLLVSPFFPRCTSQARAS